MSQTKPAPVKAISNSVVTEYSKMKGVLGVVLIGSAAHDTFDKHSDIDFYIITVNKTKLSRKCYIASNGIVVDILYNSIGEIRRYLREEQASLYRNVSHMLARGRILFKSSEEVVKLQKSARSNLKRKTRHTKEEIIMHKYSIMDFLDDARRDAHGGNSVPFYWNAHFCIQNAMELQLKLSGSYLRKPAELFSHTQQTDKRFFSLLQSFYSDDLLLPKCLTALEKIALQALTKSGGPLPKEWSI
ncbi:nucleotidyltransferase domain-containing protein [Patescibacteria group bacterium]|nr:nucleotidyltransferase domain-containing protein [Patescibacteria group bacterium]